MKELIARSKDSSDIEVQRFCDQLVSLHELKQKIERQDQQPVEGGEVMTLEQIEQLKEQAMAHFKHMQA